MAIEILPESHLDHGLAPEHLAFIRRHFANREGAFVATVALPPELASPPCGLYGPSMGDPPVDESQVTYLVRAPRKYASRVVRRPARETRELTVIAGPFGDRSCVLYTAFGGPLTPREPGDAGISTWEELRASRVFWAEHALSISS